MQFSRMFSTDSVKGTEGYLDSQKKYEILRTVIYVGLALGLLLTGFLTTGTKMNLLTVVAVLGMLPASKSAIGMIMFLRYHSFNPAKTIEVKQHAEGLLQMFDMVFTTYDKNFEVGHLVVKGNTICGYTETEKFDEALFHKHLDTVLKADNHKDVSVKIFSNFEKYIERLEQLKELETEDKNSNAIISTLKCIIL